MENPEESSPLIPRHSAADNDEKRATKPIAAPPPPPPAAAAEKHSPQAASGNPYWTADGLPLGHGSVMGEPMRRAQWDSSLFACLGRSDEFCSSDLEVCLLGSVAPCVLYGSNVERLGAGPGTFANHCLPYSGLFLIGNSIFGSNCLAPWFSYPSRTAIRRKFNLEIRSDRSRETRETRKRSMRERERERARGKATDRDERERLTDGGRQARRGEATRLDRRLDLRWSTEWRSDRRLDWIEHRKVEQVAKEVDSLKESLDKYFLRNQRRTQEARERAELLERANGESSHVLRIFDDEAQAM